jgi:hypothetical protein
MGFFSKNKEKRDDKISELPKLPPLPEMPIKEIYEKKGFTTNIPVEEQPQRKFSLPSYPNSKIGERINQEAIKDAVRDYDEEDNTDNVIKFEPKKSRTQEISDTNQEMQPSIFGPQEKKTTMEMSDWSQEMPKREFSMPKSKKQEPLYIKLEKYENVISTFNEIKLRITEIESLLKNIKEIKMKEEKELDDWEREIHTIKSRLEQIDQEIFKDI